MSCSVSTSSSTTMASQTPLRASSSTPITAIRSTLLSRSAPSVPPASQLYEPLVKGVLRHRLYKIFLHSALFCWALVTLWMTWSAGGLFGMGAKDSLFLPVRPSTLAFTVATFLAGALPVVVLRKTHLVGECIVQCFLPSLRLALCLHPFVSSLLASVAGLGFHIHLCQTYLTMHLNAYVMPYTRSLIFAR